MSAFEHPNQGDGYRLRAYMEGEKGFAEQGLTAPAMGDTAWSKTMTICKYMFLKLYWTGTEEINMAAMDTIAKLKYHDDYIAMHDGKGPTYACSTVSDMTRSILSAYGVQVMRLNGESISGWEDVSMAAFIPEYGKWVWLQPFTLSYVLMPDETPASPLEMDSYYRRGIANQLTYKSGTPEYYPDTGYGKYGNETASGNWWKGSTAPDLANGGLFYKCYYWRIYSKRPLPSTNLMYDAYMPALYIQGRTAPDLAAFPASVDDIFPTVNTLAITGLETENGVTTILFTHNMPAFKTIQRSTDGSTWVSLYGMSDAIDSTGTGSVYYRAVSMQGVPSNVIKFEY